MKRIPSLIIVVILFLASCRKNNVSKVPPEGTYTGTFTRVGLILTKSDSVKITFTGNVFNGESNGTCLVCNGTYEISSDSVAFHNACLFPANIDESRVLAGKYKIVIDGDSLFISRMYLSFSSYSDTYRLKKQ